MTTSGPKLNQPRKLGETESIQSLNHWKNHFRNYYRRCDFNKKFLDADAAAIDQFNEYIHAEIKSNAESWVLQM